MTILLIALSCETGPLRDWIVVYLWKGWRADAYATDIVDISLLPQPLSLLRSVRHRLIIHLHPANDLALNVSSPWSLTTPLTLFGFYTHPSFVLCSICSFSLILYFDMFEIFLGSSSSRRPSVILQFSSCRFLNQETAKNQFETWKPRTYARLMSHFQETFGRMRYRNLWNLKKPEKLYQCHARKALIDY